MKRMKIPSPSEVLEGTRIVVRGPAVLEPPSHAFIRFPPENELARPEDFECVEFVAGPNGWEPVIE